MLLFCSEEPACVLPTTTDLVLLATTDLALLTARDLVLLSTKNLMVVHVEECYPEDKPTSPPPQMSERQDPFLIFAPLVLLLAPIYELRII